MITFHRITQNVVPTTGYVTPILRTFQGNGIFKRRDPQVYKDLGLVAEASATILFECETYGYRAYSEDFVQPGDTTEILGIKWTAKSVNPVAIDGLVILAYIVVGK